MNKGFFDTIFGRNKSDQIVFLVDGPNNIRKGVDIDLKKVKNELQKYGNIRIAKVYLDQYASDKLIEAMVNQGLGVEITTGDVDVTMAVEAMEYIMEKDTDILALMTRDTDFIPVLKKAKKYKKKTIVIAFDLAFSIALKNTADVIIVLKPTKHGIIEHIKN
ncbi:MAG: NYN domain-containing protein [Candidatus Micrarchaeota archaeon]